MGFGLSFPSSTRVSPPPLYRVALSFAEPDKHPETLGRRLSGHAYHKGIARGTNRVMRQWLNGSRNGGGSDAAKYAFRLRLKNRPALVTIKARATK
jgi:hypothetical protein